MTKLLIISSLMLLLGMGLYAHAASSATLVYNPTSRLLTVNFEHSVRDASDHFISRAVVKVNNADAITHLIKVQDTTSGGSLIYKIPGLVTGDRINVMLQCNKGGRRSAQIIVP